MRSVGNLSSGVPDAGMRDIPAPRPVTAFEGALRELGAPAPPWA
jgi:hypothetical protein